MAVVLTTKRDHDGVMKKEMGGRIITSLQILQEDISDPQIAAIKTAELRAIPGKCLPILTFSKHFLPSIIAQLLSKVVRGLCHEYLCSITGALRTADSDPPVQKNSFIDFTDTRLEPTISRRIAPSPSESLALRICKAASS
jgi:hypothetical protein